MSLTTADRSTSGTAGIASSQAAARNDGRREITIVNDHATNIIYLAIPLVAGATPTAVVGSGIRLNAAGGAWTSTQWNGAVAVIATGAATNYTIVEV